MSTYTTSMFDKIKTAMTTQSSGGSQKYKDVLRLEPGNVYTVRLVPNVESPEKTFFHYYSYGWESFATGQYVGNVSPQTWNQKDPVAEARYSLGKHGTDEEKAKASKIMRREQWLVNVYVVNDPSNPENNGKVKLLRYGKQLNKIVSEAISGEDCDEFGAKVFDLSENGCSLKIKVERQGDFPTYVSSRFASPTSIDGLDEAQIESILKDLTDLESVFPVKSYEELKQVLNEHFYCRSEDPAESAPSAPAAAAPAAAPAQTDNVDPLDDDKVKELLDGLGD
jgi:hypothetical protein